MMALSKSSVYVSAVQDNAAWVERIANRLRNDGISVWDHTLAFAHLAAKTEIERSREHCSVYILLLSVRYLDSDVVRRSELPFIQSLSAAEARIIYVVAERCEWQSVLPLHQFATIPADGSPFFGGNGVEANLDALAKEVRRAIQGLEKEAVSPHAESAPPVSQQSQSSPAFADAREYARDRAPGQRQPESAASSSPTSSTPPMKEDYPLAQLLAARFLVDTGVEPFNGMATFLSDELIVTGYDGFENWYLALGRQGHTVKISSVVSRSEPVPAGLAATGPDKNFVILRVTSDAPKPLWYLPNFVVSRERPANGTTWECCFLKQTDGRAEIAQGRLDRTVTRDKRSYLKLQVDRKFPGGIITGAPVVVGNELVGMVAFGEESEQSLYAVSMVDVVQQMDAVLRTSDVPFNVLPSESSSSWITQGTFDRFSNEAVAVLSRAKRISTDSKSRLIHTGHMLRAFRENVINGTGSKQLTELLRLHDADLVEVLTPGAAVQQASFLPLKSPPAVSVNLRSALLTAIEKAGSEGPVEDSHILFGVLSTNKNSSVRELNKRGMTPDKVVFARPSVPPVAPKAYQAGYQSDDLSGTDLLDIAEEVNALASVMAAKDVEPPLSLGLFGDWGTGKSFFMRMLAARIETLRKDAEQAEKKSFQSAYCSHVLQITFNAWNYIDSDLWASLAAEIFENLAAAIVQERDGKDSDSPEKRALVLAAASSSEAVLGEAERKKSEAEEELRKTEEKLAELKRSEINIEAELTKGQLFRELLGFAMQDKELRKSIGQVKQTLRISEASAAASKVQSEILELEGTWRTIFFALRNEKRLWVWLSAPIVALLVALGASELLKKVNMVGLINHALAALTAIPGILVPLLAASRKALRAVKDAQAKRNELIERKRKEREAELQKDLEVVQGKVKAARDNVTAAKEKVEEINKQLDEMRADRRMADFIRARHQSADYTQQLGTISRVRSDLKHLSTLLREVRKEAQDEFEKEMKSRQKKKEDEREKKKKPKLFPRVDRIILYVDDLDRCPEETVVKVLQAVHLLLAFPLFVVVVGVDPRWLLHSLKQSSRAFQRERRDEGNEHVDEAGSHWDSTPMNYLEKIFQIPFSLRPIGKIGFGKMVDKFGSQPMWAKHSIVSGTSAEPTTAEGPAGVPVTGSSTRAEAPAATASEGLSQAAQRNAKEGSTANEIQVPRPPDQQPARQSEPSATTSAPAIDRAPEHLNITETERKFMKELHDFIPSPRAGKRFINVYRLLRASVQGRESTTFLGDQQGGTYQTAMVLLAILTGYPDQAAEIFRKVMETKPTGTWTDFTIDYQQRRLTQVPATEATAVSDKAVWTELFQKLDRAETLVGRRSMNEFIEWAPRVARYSFQSGRVLHYHHE